MKWEKLGQLNLPNDRPAWAANTHAMVPTPIQISDDLLRVYITFCDENGIGRPGYIDYHPSDLNTILDYSKEPLLDIGQDGCFDENGVLTCSVVRVDENTFYLYYVGFELGHKIRYRLLSGLAISKDGGKTFERYKKTPVLERSDSELYFRGGPFVMYDEGIFKMWYAAGSSWMEIDGKQSPVYTVNYLESKDGLEWGDSGELAIDILFDDEHGFGRPYVIKDGALYKMFYSKRIKHKGYRLGYAESADGVIWVRKDADVGLDVSESGWDSEQICYTAIFDNAGTRNCFYNGNGLGASGFGLAKLIGR